jgi:hypothetical protein
VQGWFYGAIGAKYLLALALFALGFRWQIAWTILLAGGILFIASQARRGRGRVSAPVAWLVVPVLKIVYDAAYLWGYARGRLTAAVRGNASVRASQ